MKPFDDLIRTAADGATLGRDDLIRLLGYPPDSRESHAVMAEANRISRELSGGRAEVHAQFALNLGPCACNCAFCSFARANGVFHDETRLPPDQAVAYARQLEKNSANAIYIRIVEAARRKTADALIHGKALRMEGGIVTMHNTQPQRGRGQKRPVSSKRRKKT